MSEPDVWVRLSVDEVARLPWINVDPARVVTVPVDDGEG